MGLFDVFRRRPSPRSFSTVEARKYVTQLEKNTQRHTRQELSILRNVFSQWKHAEKHYRELTRQRTPWRETELLKHLSECQRDLDSLNKHLMTNMNLARSIRRATQSASAHPPSQQSTVTPKRLTKDEAAAVAHVNDLEYHVYTLFGQFQKLKNAVRNRNTRALSALHSDIEHRLKHLWTSLKILYRLERDISRHT